MTGSPAAERQTLSDAGRQSQAREGARTAAKGERIECAQRDARFGEQSIDEAQQLPAVAALGAALRGCGSHRRCHSATLHQSVAVSSASSFMRS